MNAAPAPRVSIVVPCRNEVGALDRFLESALRQQDVVGGYEIIVADGASNDGTREALQAWLKRDERIRVVDNPAGTVSPGLNTAIRQARGEFIVRMDVHSEYAEDYVCECIAAIEVSGAQNVGGPALTRATGYFQRVNAAAYQSPFSVGGARFHDPRYQGDVDTVTYGCWRASTLHELGMFDEALVRNQDDELNLRIARTGGRIWQTPRIRSWYYPRATLPSLFRQYYQYGYWKVYVIRKHRMPASLRHLVPVLAMALGAGLLAAGFVEARAWRILVLLALVYLVLSVAASVAAARRARDWILLPLLPVVFATYHASYALGFGRALLDGSLGRSQPTSSATTLTR